MSKYPWKAWRLWDGRRWPQLALLVLAVNRRERSLAVAEPAQWAQLEEGWGHAQTASGHNTWHPTPLVEESPETLIVADDAAAAVALLGVFDDDGPWQGWQRKWWILRDPPVHVVMQRGDQRCHIVSAQSVWPRWAMQGSPAQRAWMLRQDILWWRDTLAANGLGPLRPSMSMQARQALSLSRGEATLLQGPESEHHRIAGRCSLTGGMRMPYGPGTYTDCVALDIKSCYPTIMATCEQGCGPASQARSMTVERLRELTRRQPVIADVRVDTTDDRWPKRRSGDWPQPRFGNWTTLATPELDLALSFGAIFEVGRTCTYIPGKPLQAFAERLLGVREAHTGLESSDGRALAKALANRVYGSLAQPKREWAEVGEAVNDKVAEWSEYAYGTHRRTDYRAEGGKVYKAVHAGWPRLSAPWVSAHIASQARVWLWNLCELAGGNLIYADTDGVIVQEEGAAALVEWANLVCPFNLQVEAQGDCTIYAPRRYEIGGRKRESGTKQVQVLDANEHTVTVQSTAQSIVRALH